MVHKHKQTRKFVCIIMLLLAMIPQYVAAQSAKVNKSWVEYDVTENGKTGIYFHFDFTVYNYYGEKIKAVVFVHDSKNGWMKSNLNDYKTTTGDVCTSKTLTCDYENTNWSDLKLFIPYSTLQLAEAGVTYSYCLAIRKTTNTDILQDDFHTFEWEEHSPTARINKVWVDHNYEQGGNKGMLIHADVNVINNKGNETELVCFFYDTTGSNVITTTAKYQSSSNQLMTNDRVTPRYTNSHWEDFKLFLPYNAFPYIIGKTDYTFRFKVRDPDRGYTVLASSSKQPFNVRFGGSNTPCDKPVVDWLSDHQSSSAAFTVKVGIRSSTDVTQKSITVNGSAYRGMKAVRNDGYNTTLQENITLREGDNEIIVSATNSCGTTTKSYNVFYKNQSHQITSTKRVALVIGNANYSGHPLANPVNDANDVSSSLRNLGFEVRTVINGTKREIEDAVSELRSRAKAGGVTLFYYAGHGIQKDGRNYLIPVDVTLKDASDIEYECTDVGRVLSNMESSGCTMNILVLDACRDNPFERSWTRSSSSSGLSSINAPKGTFIAYATDPGNVAQDGRGRNSPYTKAFLQTLQIPGLSLFDFFQEVQSNVMQATGDAQIPWVSSSFVGKFYFHPAQ